jgi:5-methylcytosine-specific restriction endonuclease McrA
MPMQRERYPDDWEEISLRIRRRENNCCKWCGVPNGKKIVRSRMDGKVYAFYESTDRDGISLTWPDGRPVSRVDEAKFISRKPTVVVLTVAHLGTPHADGTPGDKHDKLDVRDENLAALCQRCHLLYDLDDHIANAKVTRASKKRAALSDAGQGELL